MGIHAIALTDHDTVAGLELFQEAAKEFPQLECIPGIELAGVVECGEHLHIVGLFVDRKGSALLELAKEQELARKERNEKILEKLTKLGKPLTLEEVIAMVPPGTVIGRPHIANAMVAHKYCYTAKYAFERYIGRGKTAYVGRQLPPVSRCIQAIHDAGGLAIWAHPMTANSMTLSKCHRRIEEMMPYGLDGIEAYYPEHTQVRTGHVLNLAKEFGLLVSGGTDFHGRNMPNISIGYGYGGHYHVPDSLLIPMRERLAASGTP